MIVVIVLVLLFIMSMAVAVLAIGTIPLRTADTGRATTGEGVAHGIGWIALCISAWFAVPLFLSVFDDFGVDLPPLTQWVIVTSNKAVVYWYLALPSLALVLVLDVVVFLSVHDNKTTKILARVFSASITGSLFIAILVSMWGLVVPLLKLWTALY
jgi:hypothetical protein